ncbi:MAG: RNA polymerase sporulation sigma factor SigK [Erysipelotrichaceae bacterium]|nr:RNA polymerase sporulation sigma factor SigK [Erysipelotrichaceae bacterium]
MLNFIIDMLKELSFFVGYVKSSNFKEILSKEQEEKYIKMLKTSDNDFAREQLITHNLRLVAHIAKKYDNCGILNDDLISVGTIGLIKAIDSFSIEKSKKLSSYLSRCIENEILMYIRSNKNNMNTIFLYDSLGEDEDGQEIRYEDIIASDNIDINEKVDKDNQIKKLFVHLKKLDDFELKILSLRYGLYGKKEHTQKEIGKLLNISRSYVSRIEKKALSKLLFEFLKNEN